MKKLGWILCAFGMLLSQGCQKESVYTLSQEEVEIEVFTNDFDPLQYLLKDGNPLTESECKEVKSGAKIDTSVLGDQTFTFPQYQLNLTVHVKDTQAPTLSIIGFKVEKEKIFTWTENTLLQLRPEIKDNYDSSMILKKGLHCDSIDTSKIGKQTIKCYAEDTSGNQTTQSVTMEVVDRIQE